MIIAPAIFTDNKKVFIQQIKNYLKFSEYIDIDINSSSKIFKGSNTISTIDAINILESLDLCEAKISFHLMMDEPDLSCMQILNSNINLYKVYIHQEANIDNIEIDERFAITVMAQSELLDIEFYQKFTEVQLMTVQTGNQGNRFEPSVLEKASNLKKNGYLGTISIDGGVNEQTAPLIKKYPIGKVSVGSFFSRSQSPLHNYKILKSLFNS
jgi:pentose-5-phosphate-3-epimerase